MLEFETFRQKVWKLCVLFRKTQETARNQSDVRPLFQALDVCINNETGNHLNSIANCPPATTNHTHCLSPHWLTCQTKWTRCHWWLEWSCWGWFQTAPGLSCSLLHSYNIKHSLLDIVRQLSLWQGLLTRLFLFRDLPLENEFYISSTTLPPPPYCTVL